MLSQILRDARKYEEAKGNKITKQMRPQFHLSSRVGWMNDPNGFSYYNGTYHLFYQYHPYDSHWGPMHWGHAVSRDLLHWTYLPAALAPDSDYDRDGCFSGSGLALPDGRHLLLYTGVVNQTQPDGTNRAVQTQCIAIGDGMDYEKYPENPVIDRTKLPEGASIYDFRDPKIWKEGDTYYCVVGNCTEDKDGQILMFSSTDGFHWDFDRILAKNYRRFGRMWECPDFFNLDGKQVLLTSPQDMLPKDFEYHNGNGTVCMIGHWDEAAGDFVEESNQAIDYGIDFYASQTVLTPDGRRVMIGWMQNWDTCNLHGPDEPWFGQMSLPRELSLKNGRLIQKPVRELEQLRAHPVQYKNVPVSQIVKLEDIKGRHIDMELNIRPREGKELFRKFAVRFAQNGDYHTSVTFRPHESIVKIDRKFSGSRRAIIHQRRSKVRYDGKSLKLRLILDSYSVEVFVNGGEYVLSATMYTPLDADGILFYADGEAVMDVVKYDLITGE